MIWLILFTCLFDSWLVLYGEFRCLFTTGNEGFDYKTAVLANIELLFIVQARTKHKMTGGAERVVPINSTPASVPRLKHTSWYMSDHYICLQYLLFLSLIFRLCWLWRNRELVWDIVRGKFAKQLFSVFFLPNEAISYVHGGQSICSVLVNMQHRLQRLDLEGWVVSSSFPVCQLLLSMAQNHCHFQVVLSFGLFLRLHQALCH